MNDVLEWLQKDIIKSVVLESKNVEDFKVKIKGVSNIGVYYAEKYTYFDLYYYTVKNYPETYHVKTLHYPHLSKLSDFVSSIWYEKHSRNDHTPRRNIYIHQYREDVSEFGDVLCNGDEKKRTGDHFVTAYCNLKKGIEPDVIESVGSIKLIDRKEGLIVIAESSTHIGSCWLGIVKEFDVPVKSRIEKEVLSN